MEIEVEKYLSEDDIKEAAKVAVTHFFQEKLQYTNIETVVTNAAYQMATRMVNEQMNGDLEKIIAEKVRGIIDEMSSYSVFNDGIMGDKPSRGLQYITKAVEENKDKIFQKVAEAIADKDYFNRIKDEMSFVFVDGISKVFESYLKKGGK